LRKTEKRLVEREVEVGAFCDRCGLALERGRKSGEEFLEADIRCCEGVAGWDDGTMTTTEAELCRACWKIVKSTLKSIGVKFTQKSDL
jgi:hypothetical protein